MDVSRSGHDLLDYDDEELSSDIDLGLGECLLEDAESPEPTPVKPSVSLVDIVSQDFGIGAIATPSTSQSSISPAQKRVRVFSPITGPSPSPEQIERPPFVNASVKKRLNFGSPARPVPSRHRMPQFPPARPVYQPRFFRPSQLSPVPRLMEVQPRRPPAFEARGMRNQPVRYLARQPLRQCVPVMPSRPLRSSVPFRPLVPFRPVPPLRQFSYMPGDVNAGVRKVVEATMSANREMAKFLESFPKEFPSQPRGGGAVFVPQLFVPEPIPVWYSSGGARPMSSGGFRPMKRRGGKKGKKQ